MKYFHRLVLLVMMACSTLLLAQSSQLQGRGGLFKYQWVKTLGESKRQRQ